jgi:tRNA pseudouridine38-40 synthase
MVRTLVGTMLEREPRELRSLLAGAPRSAAGATAPACGLTLLAVGYDALEAGGKPDAPG